MPEPSFLGSLGAAVLPNAVWDATKYALGLVLRRLKDPFVRARVLGALKAQLERTDLTPTERIRVHDLLRDDLARLDTLTDCLAVQTYITQVTARLGYTPRQNDQVFAAFLYALVTHTSADPMQGSINALNLIKQLLPEREALRLWEDSRQQPLRVSQALITQVLQAARQPGAQLVVDASGRVEIQGNVHVRIEATGGTAAQLNQAMQGLHTGEPHTIQVLPGETLTLSAGHPELDALMGLGQVERLELQAIPRSLDIPLLVCPAAGRPVPLTMQLQTFPGVGWLDLVFTDTDAVKFRLRRHRDGSGELKFQLAAAEHPLTSEHLLPLKAIVALLQPGSTIVNPMTDRPLLRVHKVNTQHQRVHDLMRVYLAFLQVIEFLRAQPDLGKFEDLMPETLQLEEVKTIVMMANFLTRESGETFTATVGVKVSPAFLEHVASLPLMDGTIGNSEFQMIQSVNWGSLRHLSVEMHFTSPPVRFYLGEREVVAKRWEDLPLGEEVQMELTGRYGNAHVRWQAPAASER